MDENGISAPMDILAILVLQCSLHIDRPKKSRKLLKEAKAGTLTRTGLSVRLKYVLASSESSFNQIRTGDMVMMAAPELHLADISRPEISSKGMEITCVWREVRP